MSSKISKGIGIIARLRHFVPLTTLLNIYRSLIDPYISYGLFGLGLSRKRKSQQNSYFAKVCYTLDVFFGSQISQCSSFRYFANSADENALL